MKGTDMKGTKTVRAALAGSLVLLVVGAAAFASAGGADVSAEIAEVEQYVQPESAPTGIAAGQEEGLVRITDPVVEGCAFIVEITDAKGVYCMDDAIAEGMPEAQAYELAGRITGDHFTAKDLADFVADGGVDGSSGAPVA